MALRRLVVLVALLAVASPLAAQDADVGVDPLALQVHAFASQGFLVTTEHDYLANSKDGSFELTEVGINFTKPLTNDLRAGMQLFSRKLGSTGNYSAKFDWFYLDYRWRDWLGIRAGRVKVPFGLYNEVNDVDAGRVAVLLPQSVYPISNRDYLLAQTGGELYGRLDLRRAGVVDYRVYGGTIFLDVTRQIGAPYDIKRFVVPYLVGGRLLWETPLPGLRGGGSVQYLRLDTDLYFDPAVQMQLQMAGVAPASFRGDVAVKIPVVLWVGSLEYSVGDWLFAAEYSRWYLSAESSLPAVFPGPNVKAKQTSERMYALIAYHATSWLQPGAYYSLLFPNTADRSGRQNVQHDIAGTLRFDINEHWLVKLEGHYMRGTAALSRDLNGGVPLSELTRNWALFLIKTTAYF